MKEQSQSPIAAQAEELAQAINAKAWRYDNRANIFDVRVATQLCLDALTAAAAQEHERCNQTVKKFYEKFYTSDWDIDKINRLLAAAPPQGMVMVPRKPTVDMILAIEAHDVLEGDGNDVWEAALAAAEQEGE